LERGEERNGVKLDKTVCLTPFWTCKAEKRSKIAYTTHLGILFITFYPLLAFFTIFALFQTFSSFFYLIRLLTKGKGERGKALPLILICFELWKHPPSCKKFNIPFSPLCAIARWSGF
jgi:hypothetical protein